MPTLSKADAPKLRKIYRDCKGNKLAERWQVLYLRASGYLLKDIAFIVARDEDTVSAWIYKYEQTGEIEDEPREGSEGKISSSLEKKIVKLVDENKPFKHGWNAARWDCKELRDWLEEKQHVIVTEEAVRQLLLRNGFTWKKTGYDYLNGDKDEQRVFLRKMKRIMATGVTTFFLDEANTKLHPKNGYIWSREKGKPLIPTYSSHAKVTTIGAVNVSNGKELHITRKEFNAQKVIELLLLILSCTRGEIVVFLDRHKAHTTERSHEIQDFVAKHPRLRLEYFPRCSPKLNPIEMLWWYARGKKLNNRLYKNTRALAISFSKNLSTIPAEVIKSVCCINHLLKPNPKLG